MTRRWFINITGTAHNLWTGALPGTSKDFDEREFRRQVDGGDTESDAESAHTRVPEGRNGGPHELPGQDRHVHEMSAGRD